ncbi:hypothetical protein [Clostridium intestinale]|uniref:Uncharacterized protein n=1 Tax=Clostridium intestinale TaxID=36845 RepID=A0A7D6ZX89_9CLOT|nr:hypothetical protein [Clostridium intestinale]QLY79674.1 hypothetical protein HZF06_22080 [Clostridium intestinale]
MRKWNVYLTSLLILSTNSLLYGIVSAYSKAYLSLWSVSHYFTYSLVLFLFSKISIGTNFKSSFVKRIFTISVIMNAVTIFLGWHLAVLDRDSSNFIFTCLVIIIVTIVVFGMTIYSMKNSTKNDDKYMNCKISLKDEIKVNSEIIEGKDIINIERKSIILNSALVFIEYILIVVLYLVIPRMLKQSDYRIILVLLSIPVILGLILVNGHKNKLYYNQKKIYLKSTIIETILIVLGISIVFFFEGVIYYKTNFLNFFVLIVPISMLYSIFNTNYKISVYYYNILKNEEKK